MEFNELMLKRRSIRKFDESKKVTEEQLKEIISAALMAPTWANTETGRYYVAASDEAFQTMRERVLHSTNCSNTDGASAYVVTTYVQGQAGYKKGQQENEWGEMWGAYDLGLQAAYFTLKAADLGLDTLIMGIRNSEALREIFSIPENEAIGAVIAVGYRAAEPNTPKRKALDDVMKIF